MGLAAGDALGTTLEFKKPGAFQPIDDMVGGGPFSLQPGQWTDDTSMALCLAESLLQCAGLNPIDQMQRYVRWRDEGYLSSTGRCFDIGGTISAALSRFERTGEAYAGSRDPHKAGNGSLMRLGPVPLYYAGDPQAAVHMSADSSRTTHGAAAAVDACRYMAALMIGALQGVPKNGLLAAAYSPVPGLWERELLDPEIAEVAGGSFKLRQPPKIKGTGHVVRSLEAALWAFHHSTCFQDGALLAANLGDDADTTAAIYGQLAGAYYGASGIPKPWLDRLSMRSYIQELADGLLDAGKGNGGGHGAGAATQDQASERRPNAPNTPFERSYWVVPGKLLAGCYPGDCDKTVAQNKLTRLLLAGVRCVINLTEEGEAGKGGTLLMHYQRLLYKVAFEMGVDITYLRIPIRDVSVPPAAVMTAILDVIDQSMERGRPTYVHCWGGRGRTGTVVGCYLARHGIAAGEECLRRISELRQDEPTRDQPSPETEEQRSMVTRWPNGR